MPETRGEHLSWCKERALEYVERGELHHAWASFTSDMNKHDETKNHPFIMTATQLVFGGHANSAEEMRKLIEGFN